MRRETRRGRQGWRLAQSAPPNQGGERTVTADGNPPAYENLDVCRDVDSIAALLEDRKHYTRSRPNWAGNRIAAIGEERYTRNLELVSKGGCGKDERITLQVSLVPDAENPVDPRAVMIASVRGEVLGYLAKEHAVRWGRAINGLFSSIRVVCRDAGVHQRTFKGGKRNFYLTVDMTDEEWLERAASR